MFFLLSGFLIAFIPVAVYRLQASEHALFNGHQLDIPISCSCMRTFIKP